MKNLDIISQIMMYAENWDSEFDFQGPTGQEISGGGKNTDHFKINPKVCQ